MDFKFVPIFPAGASAYAICICLHRINSVKLPDSRSAIPRLHCGNSLSGLKPAHLRALLPWLSLDELPSALDDSLLKYTLVGYYARERSTTALDPVTWRALVLDRGAAERLRTYCGDPQVAATDGLRWCASCVQHDIDTFGIPMWRFIHQVPYLHHCPMHREPLLRICASCRRPLDKGGGWRLPGDDCPACGSSRFVAGRSPSTSAGYFALHEMALNLSQAKLAPNLRDEAKAGILRLGTERYASQTISRTVKERWGVRNGEELLSVLHYRPCVPIDLTGSKAPVGGFEFSHLSLLVVCDALTELGACKFELHTA